MASTSTLSAETPPKPLQAWAGAFGDGYTARNTASDAAVQGRARIWAGVLDRLAGAPPRRVLEVGANLGLNLRALNGLTDAELWAQEPNASARARLVDDAVLPADHVLEGFGHEIPLADGAVDLAFTTGVLIHVDPELLEATLREIHRVAKRYIFCAEYFAPGREAIAYRGEEGLLYRDDFGGRYLDLFPDLELVDCGFYWRRTTVMDDCVWQLFRKV